ncbi:MAG: amidohydrolase family protein [Litorilinea sp.]
MTDSMIPVIDTHLHFWDLATYPRTGWIEDKPLLYRNYLPEDVKPHFDACSVNYGVIVEAARDSHEMNLWWLELAAEYEYIGAVVAGCSLEQDDLAEWFDAYAESAYFVGVRTSPAGAPDQWLTNAATRRGLDALNRRELRLDLLLGYETFAAVAELAAAYPDLGIMLNHCAHPPIREDGFAAWAAALEPLVQHPNIMVKYSSLLLYSYPDSQLERLRPYTNFLLEHFGPTRLAWGSNWPVELLGGSYVEAFGVMDALAVDLSPDERAAVFGGNAQAFYRVASPAA